jgi:AraC-like DNA-binding protein
MDAITSLLDGPRARSAFVLQVVMEPPFCIRVADEAPLSVIAVTAGSAVLVDDHGEVVTLTPGDVALARGPAPYLIADAPGRDPQVLILPGQACTTPDGIDLKVADVLGVRTWGTSASGAVRLIVGTYETAGEVSRRLLEALPPLALVRGGTLDSPLVDLLAHEIGRDDPGQDAVLDRLLDLLAVTAVRAWFARSDADAPAWYRAHDDPITGHALRLLHDRPAEPWTVAALAREVGVSRATLARRFTDTVGETPMAYLTEWRLALAADLILEPDATVAGVARQVGYGTGFALSAAFTRVRGISPTDHRTRAGGAERALAASAARR